MQHLSRQQKQSLFKALEARRDELKQTLQGMRQNTDHLAMQGNHGDWTDHTSYCVGTEENLQTIHRTEQRLTEVEDALERWRQGTYGIIQKTQEYIPYIILKNCPYTTTIPETYRKLHPQTSFKIGTYKEESEVA